MEGIEKTAENKWQFTKTGEELVLEKDESPLLGHTVGEKAHNWEALRFRSMVLKWSDICTESKVHYYCDIPVEWTHSLELTNSAAGGAVSLVESSVRNLEKPQASTSEQHPERLQPWLDAVLGDALGIAPTMDNWVEFCSSLKLTNFFPSTR